MDIKYLTKKPSVLNNYIAELRDVNIQKDSMRFRRNLERIGEIFAYEISKTLKYKKQEIQTPLGISTEVLLQESIVLASILRAGVPFHSGLLNVFDKAENAFVSAYRKYTEDGHFDIHIEYISTPDLSNKIVILADPMLATGSSIELAYNALKSKGKPSHVHLISIVASQAGVDYIQNMLSGEDITLWVGAIDEELNAKSYIVPGLGDVGDLAYGIKL
jgi:uracil phosphoribosyltransferase